MDCAPACQERHERWRIPTLHRSGTSRCSGTAAAARTSLVEAMLFAAGETNRLGTVAEEHDGSRLRRRRAPPHHEHQRLALPPRVGRGEGQPHRHAGRALVPGSLTALQGGRRCAAAGPERHGGVEVQTERLWSRAGELGLPRAAVVDARPRARRLRRHHGGAGGSWRPARSESSYPIGSEAGFRGVVNLGSMTATTYERLAGGLHGADPRRPRRRGPVGPRGPHRRGGRERRRLIEKYLEGEEITTEELIGAILAGQGRRIFPVVCGGAPAIGVDRALDLIAEALPSPADAAPRRATDRLGRGRHDPAGGGRAGRRSASRPWPTSSAAASTPAGDLGHAPRRRPRDLRQDRRQERVGQLFTLQGKDHVALQEIRAGRHRRRRQAQGGRDRGRAHHRRPVAPSQQCSSRRRS